VSKGEALQEILPQVYGAIAPERSSVGHALGGKRRLAKWQCFFLPDPRVLSKPQSITTL